MATPGDSSREETITRGATAEEEATVERERHSEVDREGLGRDDVVAEVAVDIAFNLVIVFLGMVGGLFVAAALAFPSMVTEFGLLATASFGMIAALLALRRLIDNVNDFYGM